MNENIKWIAAAVAVVGLSAGALVYFSKRSSPEPAPEVPVAAEAPPPAIADEPAVKHPLPASDTPDALPALEDSDAPLLGAISALVGTDALQLAVPKNVIRHVVVTIDNLPNEKLAERLRPLKPMAGKFAVSGSEEAPVLDPANFERYSAFVQMVRTVDTKTLVTTYTRYYPLFQQAYVDLGHPPEYFNDRVIEVIDHLLEAPEISGPVELAQPGVLYQYADPKLESLSSGQKVLVRMGSANALVVKAKLRELRSALIASRPGD
jgi:hypothetical protein